MAAVVLSSEENSYFASSPLRRSHSQTKFIAKQPGFHSSASTSRISDAYAQPAKIFTDSAPSSIPSSPRTIQSESTDLSWSSTPASNLPITPNCDDDVQIAVHPDDHFVFPHYDEASFFESVEDLEPPTSPKTGDSYTVSPADHDTSATPSRPGTPDFPEALDDTAVRVQPSRHVDYLSHNWKEEDIWSSWKYVISRRGEYNNATRLENASWRTWMKAKNKLRTVSPETLNWFKDCDVTWLYGPLQTGSNDLHPEETEPNSSTLSKSNSFINNKKPILKKRSMSEIMLQRSLSNSSLVKQAAAAVQAQEKDWQRRLARPSLGRASTDYISSPFSSRGISRENSLFPSVASSGIVSPTSDRKHIHFNEQVEQCIAVEVKGDDDEELEENPYGEDSDSEDSGLTMKRSTRKRTLPLKRKLKGPVPTESKTIAMLPSTTLKYRDDTLESQETAMKHSYRSPVISPSSSQETLRPSKKSGKLFFVDDDEDEDDEDADSEDDVTAVRGWRSPTIPNGAAASGLDVGSSGLQRSSSTNSLTAEPAGMRRTPSGMFMPYEEGEPVANDGILGRVIDTVNTARDIAHVIWNVGWRK